MPKARINKFIFQEANVFFRMKTKAKNLVVKKDGDNYSMEFSSNNKKIDIPVLFMPNLAELPDQNSDSTPYAWGKLLKEDSFYYLVPEKNSFAIKVGPIAEGILDSDIEIDWPNIQWGS